MHLAQKPVVLAVTTPADEEVDSEMLDPFPISYFESLEEIVQTGSVAEHEDALLFCSLDQGLDFGVDLVADSEDAIIAMRVR